MSKIFLTLSVLSLIGCASLGDMSKMKDLAVQCRGGQVNSCMDLANILSSEGEESDKKKLTATKIKVNNSSKNNEFNEACVADLEISKKRLDACRDDVKEAETEVFECNVHSVEMTSNKDKLK